MVQMLIGDVQYPTILQPSIAIDRTASDPIPTFRVTIQDDPSQLAISELQEVVLLDEYQLDNPAHNLLVNPLFSPYTSEWTQQPASGGTIAQGSPGVVFTAANATGTFSLTQTTQPGLVTPGQSYMISVYINAVSMVGCQAYFTLNYLAADGVTVLGTVTKTVSNNNNRHYTDGGPAPDGTASIQIELGVQITNGTNSGSATFTSVQLEPECFTDGNYQLYYPTPDCNVSQANCIVLPDGTSIRQYRLFGGLVTKATAGAYIGKNRQWSLTVSGYAWLLQKQQLNQTWTNTHDNTIIANIISEYFANALSTAQVVQGALLDTFGYAYNGTARDAFDALSANANYLYYVDAYRVTWYQPPGYTSVGFALSDSPDMVTSFPYYAYSLDTDATQLGNTTLVTGATGIAAIEYDAQSIAIYNQKLNGQGTFWRTVNDSTIPTLAAAQQRAIAENSQYAYARKIAHLSTNQFMVPGTTVLLTSSTDQLTDDPFLIQKATLVLKGFDSTLAPVYECVCDLGDFNPDMVNITVKMLRQQTRTTNAVSNPTPGLMLTESMTFVDAVTVTAVHASPSTYGKGIYGTSTYASGVPGVPTTKYGKGKYGDSAHGYN